MARYTEQYKSMQSQMHNAIPEYGTSGYKHADRILQLAASFGTKDILDYGCGKQTLSRALPFAITNYDPFIAGFDADPRVHDVVVCSDVLEHIEPDCLDDVLAHLTSKVGKVLFVDVACRPAKKTLPDGRNAHLIQTPPSWWMLKFCSIMEPLVLQTYEVGGFVAVFAPKGK